MTIGFHEIVFSTRSIETSADAFLHLGGWGLEHLVDAQPDQAAAWGLPEDTRIEQALLVPQGERHGTIRLVRFHDVPQIYMRPGSNPWDTGGIFDIDCYCHDAAGLFEALLHRGWQGHGEPVDYDWGGFSVKQCLPHGPGGLVVGMLEPKAPPMISLAEYSGFSRAFNSAQIVADWDKAMAFYCDGLGWKPMVDTLVEDVVEPGQEILGLPMPLAKDTPRKVALLHPDGGNDGSLELIHYPEIQGKQYGPRCVAPNLGWLCWRCPVDDAAAYAAEITARGVIIESGLRRYSLPPYGAVDIFSVRTPDGAQIDFFSHG